MVIETQRLFIRRAREGDTGAILAACRDPAVHEMYAYAFSELDNVCDYLNVLRREYERDFCQTMVIARKDADALIGMITLEKDRIFPRAEVSYWVEPAYRGLGYATEAVRAMIGYGFRTHLLQRIQAMRFPENPASGRVLEKAGMRYEGTLRRYVGFGEDMRDCLMYAILRDEFSSDHR